MFNVYSVVMNIFIHIMVHILSLIICYQETKNTDYTKISDKNIICCLIKVNPHDATLVRAAKLKEKMKGKNGVTRGFGWNGFFIHDI